MLLPTIFYVLLCSIVAYLGRNRLFGFWGYFFASLIVTPFGGLLLLIPSEKRSDKE